MNPTIMEIINNYSRIKLEDENLVSEVGGLLFNRDKKTFNTVKYSDIKEMRLMSTGKWLYITFYALGLLAIAVGFGDKRIDVYGEQVWMPATAEEKYMGAFIGITLIACGLYIHRKIGKVIQLTVKHFEGKRKSTQLFLSENRSELEGLQAEIQKRIYKK